VSSKIPVSECWFLTGPTAAGKSAVGLLLAEKLKGEIISLDSMALYRGMDIGTAKPTAAERAATPHHLIDLIQPSRAFSLAEYVDAAAAAVGDILARGRRPIFVGGTPLYLKALLRGMFEGPAADWAFRDALAAEATAHGEGWLHEQLAAVDPLAASRLHPQDAKRVIRALEVYEKTGQPISSLQQQFDQAIPLEQTRVFVLDWPREELYRRINARVDQMFADGLVDEVQGLLARGVEFSHTAAQALGYREVLTYLAGEGTLEFAQERVQARTRAFARRQLTWFRSLTECRFVPVSKADEPATIAATIAETG
jgi:tRNA dimethylallyltransferase